MKKPKKETIKTLDDACLKLWSSCIITRDGKCRITGSQSGLTSHHIRSRGHASTRFDLENGLCIAWKWHFLQKANPERFQDSVIDVIGQEKYEELKAKSLRPLKRNIADMRDEKARLEKELKALQADYGFKSLPF
jgi:hypothetical protein